MKNEKLIIKKIIKNYIRKFANRDFEERNRDKKYFRYLQKENDLKTLLNELYEKVSYQKKRERREGKAEYYDTI